MMQTQIENRHDTKFRAKRAEKNALITGSWGAWEQFDIPHGAVGNDPTGWNFYLTKVYRNDAFCVMVREFQSPIGIVKHAAIRNVSNTDIKWAQKQRIKNEIFGEESYAVEVFPQQSQLVDAANMYHLWILEKALPFSLKDNISISHIQNPFATSHRSCGDGDT